MTKPQATLTKRQREFVDYLRAVEGGWAHDNEVAEALDTSKPGLVLNKLTFDLNLVTCRVSQIERYGYDWGLREIVRPDAPKAASS